MILIKYLHQKSDQGSIRKQDIYRSSFKLRKIYSYITIKLHMHEINSYYRHTNSVHMLSVLWVTYATHNTHRSVPPIATDNNTV
jgi:hypothetical protein